MVFLGMLNLVASVLDNLNVFCKLTYIVITEQNEQKKPQISIVLWTLLYFKLT
jgi:hypothetical protein